MTKFNVGDKVRVVSISPYCMNGFKVGDNCEVTSDDGYGRSRYGIRKDGLSGYADAVNLAHYNDSNRRLTKAEAKIAALEAEVKALKDAGKPKKITPVQPWKQTPNQRRADVIKRAQAFVADLEESAYGHAPNRNGNKMFNYKRTNLAFHVNAEKGVVTALSHLNGTRELAGKAFAKCAPGDVFNADIGKAVAAGRLYGVKVPKDFTDAVKPTEVVVGMVVAGSEKDGFYSPTKRFKLTEPGRYLNSFYYEGSTDWLYRGQIGAIIDDTNAVYL